MVILHFQNQMNLNHTNEQELKQEYQTQIKEIAVQEQPSK